MRVVLAAGLSFACIVCAQQAPVGDIYQSGSGAAQSPAQAEQNLYKIAVEITDDPSSGYVAKTDSWPQADAAQANWNRSMTYNGNALTQQQRQTLIPCADHSGQAIGSAERGYRIQISQKNNPQAQADAKKLLANARKFLAMCNQSALGNNSTGAPPIPGGVSTGPGGTGTPGGGQNPPIPGGVGTGTPGSTGTPGRGQNPPIPGGVSTGPSGTGTPGGGQTPPPATPNNTPIDYVRGLADGVGDCIKGFVDQFAAVGAMAQGNFVLAAQILGLQPGQSVILKAAYQELVQTKVVGQNISAYDRGKTDGRRLCTYIAPKLAGEAAKTGLAAGLNKFAGPGATRLNPLQGKALADAIKNGETQLPNNQGWTSENPGKWVDTPLGPKRLGGFIDRGSFSSVYEDADNAAQVLKIGNDPAESPGSFTRQVTGTKRFGDAGVKTPPIRAVDPGTPTKPGVLITDNVFKQKTPVQKFTRLQIRNNPTAFKALKNVFDKTAAKGSAWADGHPNNVVFEPDGKGGLTPVVIDPDFLMTPDEFAKSLRDNSTPGGVLKAKLGLSEYGNDLRRLEFGTPFSAGDISQWLFDTLYPPAETPGPLSPGGGTGTVPRGTPTVPRP